LLCFITERFEFSCVWETSGDTTSGAELLEIYLNMSEVTDYTNKNVTINM